MTRTETAGAGRRNVRWGPVLNRARDIVNDYDTLVTLRQLFYRLVAELLIPNTRSKYTYLSKLTAEARRVGDFPDLVDRGRGIVADLTFSNPDAALAYTTRIYRRDRTEGQPVSLYLGVEKAGIVNQLDAWFGELGLPILSLGGYASQSFVDEVRDDVAAQKRPAVLLYAGDFDPSGIDIIRDFEERCDCFTEVRRIALNPEQVIEYNLPESVDPEVSEKLQRDPRFDRFVARFGRATQIELDALPPDVLRSLYSDAIDDFRDTSRFEALLAEEARERAALANLARRGA